MTNLTRARLSVAVAWICALSLLAAMTPSLGETLRIGAQKSGTFGWELAVIKARGLDGQADLDLEITDQATTEAGKIAISGGAVDIIISDWLWVSRERALGHKLKFVPYSNALGAVMAKADGPIVTLADLGGKTLGVAGGPIDKSWLLLQAYAKRDGLDLGQKASIIFAAPPLLAEKTARGELDAALEFWNFSAALELRGFRRVVDIGEVERGLGAKGPVAMVGYVFDEEFAAKHAQALAKFLDISRRAKDILASDATLWPDIMAHIGQKDPDAAALFQKRYAEGVPRRAIADEESDAGALFKTLADVGGPELVETQTALDPGTYYKTGEQ